MVRMVTLYNHEVDPDHGVMHVTEDRVEHFKQLGWTSKPPEDKPAPAPKPAPKKRKPRGTEGDK